MEWSAVRPNSPAREGSAGRALKLACVTLLCVAFVALSSHTVNRRDGLLQTVRPVAQVYAQPQMMRQQRAQEQLMQQQPPIVMGQVMPSLEEAPPAAPIAEPAAAAPLSVPVAPAAEVAPAGMPAAGMAPAIPGMAPPAGMEAPAAPGPMCPVEQQCQDTTGACLDGIGCLTQDATGAVMCSCGEGAPAEEAPQPPPPVPGSLEWMEEPENAIVAPGPEEAAAGSNLAMTESGNIAVNLNNYLHYKAQREQTAAKMEKILLSELQKAQPCEIEMGEDGVARCKAGTGVGSSSWIPDEMFGFSMPWASSEESGGQDQALTSGEAGQLKSNLEGVEQSAQGLTLHETQDIRQIESQADAYKGW